jgi:hypothetical protein
MLKYEHTKMYLDVLCQLYPMYSLSLHVAFAPKLDAQRHLCTSIGNSPATIASTSTMESAAFKQAASAFKTLNDEWTSKSRNLDKIGALLAKLKVRLREILRLNLISFARKPQSKLRVSRMSSHCSNSITPLKLFDLFITQIQSTLLLNCIPIIFSAD